MRKQSGFTLIELVAVIVLLGILAVTAVPRFVDLQADARAATVQGIAAAMNGAMVQIYAKSLVTGAASNATDTVDGGPAGTVEVIFGYPEAAGATPGAQDIRAVINLDTAGQGITFTSDGTTAQTAADTTVVIGYSATCEATYTQATGATAPATVVIDTSSC